MTSREQQKQFEDNFRQLDFDPVDRDYLVDQFVSDETIDHDWEYQNLTGQSICYGLDDGCTCDRCEDVLGFYVSRIHH
jgi:hypothetical protein